MRHFTCLCAFLVVLAPAGVLSAPAPKRKPTAVIDARTELHVKWVQERLVSCAHIAIVRDKKIAELPIVRRHMHDPKDAKELVTWLEKNFRIECIRNTKIIHVSFRDGTPEEQAAIINLVVNDFLQKQVGSRRDFQEGAIKDTKNLMDNNRRAGKVTKEQATEADKSIKKREEYIRTLPALIEPAKAH